MVEAAPVEIESMATARPENFHKRPILFGLIFIGAVFVSAIAVIHFELEKLSIVKIYAELSSLAPVQFGLAAAATMASYAALTFNDRLALGYAGKVLPFSKTVFASFTSYALSNSLGLPFLTGGAVRYRLYSSWGLGAREIAIIALVTSAALYLGAVAITGAGLVFEAPRFESVFHVPAPLTLIGGLICFTALAFFLFQARSSSHQWKVREVEITAPGWRNASAQIFFSVIDWSASAFVLFILLPADLQLNFLAFLPIFVVASLLGALSGLPGGVGVFDAIVLVAAPTDNSGAVAAALIAYRAIYYLLPLFIAAALLAVHQARRAGPQIQGAAARAQDFSETLAPTVFSIIAFFAGLFMLISAVTPSLAEPLGTIGKMLPLAAIELSHFLASIIGALLLIVAMGLRRRLDHAWTFAMVLLAAGIVLTLAKSAGIHEAVTLSIAAGLLGISKGAFYRKTPLAAAELTPPWAAAFLLAIGAIIWLGFFSYAHVDYKDELWWSFSLDGEASRFLRASAGAASILILFLAARWLRPGGHDVLVQTPAPDLAAVQAIIENSKEAHADANLALLGDKQFLLSDSGKSFIMYGVRGRNWIAMGEPVGQPDEKTALLWKFRELADVTGATPIFYSVRKEFLPFALEIGLTAQKIGETALVPLTTFSLDGSARAKLRQAQRRHLKEGSQFAILTPQETEQNLESLGAISDQWLESHQGVEKGFSLGRFDNAYLRNFPTAIVRRGGEIVAFANIWTTGDKSELSIDLMRYGDNAPRGVMDYLFTELMLWGKAQGFRHFDLGMAPLSGLEARRLSPMMTKLGAFIFEHGEKLYGFEGLRDYKDKFDPAWEPLYIAAPGQLTVPIALGDVALLTSGGIIGLLKKSG